MAKLIIHRGTREIGGSAVEIFCKKARLLFDFGIPLETMVKDDWKIEDYKLPINGLYKSEKSNFDAVFLTHAHPDHYGLIQLINSKIPIYTSKITYDILTKISPLLPKQSDDRLNLKILDGEINFDGIKIIPHNVDHSIAGACAYEIQTDCKTILYTGDIRFHGRASWQSSILKRKIKNSDYLIMEGTTLGRDEQNIITEQDLEEQFVKVFKEDKLPLVQFSPQNIDRFVTIYRACLNTNKILVIDPYTAYVLEVFSSISKHIPQFDWNNIKVNFAKSDINKKLAQTKDLFKYKSKKITLEEIINNPQKYVVKGNSRINRQILSRLDKNEVHIIFSMWKGYLDRPSWFDNYKDIITPLHTSGHAYIKDLQEFVQKIKPKVIIPIHTELPEKYAELYDTEIKILKDGEILNL